MTKRVIQSGRVLTGAATPPAAVKFGFAGVEDSTKRRPTTSRVRHEDVELRTPKRERAVATTREDARNWTVLAWMIRRHLDYVTRFEPHFRTGNADLDRAVKQFIADHSRRQNFDHARRHNRNSFMRLLEAQAVLGGDCAAIKLGTGRLQAIEPDRIARPKSWGKAKISKDRQALVRESGLIEDADGAVAEYCFCNRGADNQGIEFDHFEKAENVIFHGYFQRFDQTRGNSPLLTALNDVADCKEAWLYNVLKIKLHALLGIALMRKSPETFGNTVAGAASDLALQSSGGLAGGAGVETNAGAAAIDDGAKVVFKPDTINILDLDAGDDVKVLESQTPPQSVTDFTSQIYIRAILLALDIPYTAWDGTRASFSARIADRAEYEEACEWKRDNIRDVLSEIYSWRLRTLFDTDPLFARLVNAADLTIDGVIRAVQWMPTSTPWMDSLAEAKGEALKVAIGYSSTPRGCAARGADAYEIVDEQAEYLAYAKAKGVPIFYADSGQAAVQSIVTEQPQPESVLQ